MTLEPYRLPRIYYHNGGWWCHGNIRMYPSLTDAGHAWCARQNKKLWA